MKKGVIVVVILCVAMISFNTGCTDKKPEHVDSVSTDSFVADTIKDSDTVAMIVEETPMPKAADELFDDFFFNFINSKPLQRGRIAFPLAVKSDEGVSYIKRKDWQMEHFFRDQEFYTLIFDSEKQMGVVKDTTIDNVVVEKIRLNDGLVEQFQFKRIGGKWAMTEIRNTSVENVNNASFLLFLHRFLNEPGFQAERIEDPLKYYGPDPDGEDDSKYVNTSISADTWKSYLPQFDGSMLYNILYGQKYSAGKKKILQFKGIANGLETELIFKEIEGEWKLIELKV